MMVVKWKLCATRHHVGPSSSCSYRLMPSLNTLDTAAAATTAVASFLRGVERRAALLAELQRLQAAGLHQEVLTKASRYRLADERLAHALDDLAQVVQEIDSALVDEAHPIAAGAQAGDEQ